MATIEIDGKRIEAHDGQMVIEAADEHGINIPRFCYHKKLSVAANCRMCLVEVEKSRKPLPACATPVTDGMKVFTQSKMAREAQEIVMEFLLINHPLDCPICDQGGECELQDVSLGFGKSESEFTEEKRAVDDDSLGSLIATDMTRCIHCTRCVRFGEEVAGFRELGMTGRGEHSQIGTYITHNMTSEVSGNVIDLCPVGALTSRPYRYSARAWEMSAQPSISPHDCLGSNINIHTRRDQVMRVVPRDNESINETWISDRDRFAYTGLQTDRLAQPMIKQHGQWRETDWQTALQFAVEGLSQVKQTHGTDKISALTSPSATLEEMYLLQKLMRGIGVQSIDHRVRECDFRDQDQLSLYPGSEIPYKKLSHSDNILIIGSDLQREQPLAALRVRHATTHGARVSVLNCIDYDFHFPISEKTILSPKQLPSQLAQLAQTQLPENSVIITGALLDQHPDAASLRYWVAQLAERSGAKIMTLTSGANTAGAWLAGCVPHRLVGGATNPESGTVWSEPKQAYVLHNLEPEYDCANPAKIINCLNKAEFVVSLSPYVTETMREYASVILPTVPSTETGGTFVNLEGTYQTFQGCIPPWGEARPAWKVFRVLGNLFECPDFEYISVADVLADAQAEIARASCQPKPRHQPKAQKFVGLHVTNHWGIYRGDNLVRRAAPLQASVSGAAVYCHPEMAEKLKLIDTHVVAVKQLNGGEVLKLPMVLDPSIAMDTVYIPLGFEQTKHWQQAFGAVELTRAG